MRGLERHEFATLISNGAADLHVSGAGAAVIDVASMVLASVGFGGKQSQI
jgi:hypothetical protein